MIKDRLVSRDNNRKEDSEFPRLVSFDMKDIKHVFWASPELIVRLT